MFQRTTVGRHRRLIRVTKILYLTRALRTGLVLTAKMISFVRFIAAAGFTTGDVPRRFRSLSTLSIVRAIQATRVLHRVLISLQVVRIANAKERVSRTANGITFSGIFSLHMNR